MLSRKRPAAARTPSPRPSALKSKPASVRGSRAIVDGETFTRRYSRPRWHPSFPPPDVVLYGSQEEVAEWLRCQVPPVPRAGPSCSSRQRWLARMSAAEYVAARRAGIVSCREYATVLADRMEHYRDMNQFMYWDILPNQRDVILKQSDALDKMAAEHGIGAIAPLYGLPVPCKGTAATTDFPSSAGSGLLHGFYAKRDAAIVTLLRQAHAVIMGKTNVPEFAAGLVTANYANGRTLNPYGSIFTSGGSSGGSASAVATYIAPVAITEDTGGSTRHPAMQCHNFGFDPSRNHFPNLGNPGMTFTNDQIGLNARCLEDILLVDAALLGTHSEHEAKALSIRPVSGIRVGAPQYPFVEFTPLEGGACQKSRVRVSRSLDEKYEAVKNLLKQAQVPVIEREWPDVESAALGRRVNAVAEIFFGRVVNGRFIDLLSSIPYHSFSGQMQAWVAAYLEAPVSNVDLVADMMRMGRACDTGYHHRRIETELEETDFRYFMSVQPELVCVWNSYFDTHGVDILLTPPQFPDVVTYPDVAGGAIPLLTDDGDGFRIKNSGTKSSLALTYDFFKSTPIPKLVVPTGLDTAGRPTAVTLWGRAPPPERMFDDAFAKTFDLDFLYEAKPLVDLIQGSPCFRRVDAPLVCDLTA